MGLSINNARWKGTKFTIEAMKAANGKATEAVIELLPNLPPFADTIPNRLIFDFHKDQLIQTLNVKVPEEHKTSSQPLVFDYQSAFDVPPADGYETILEAILKGDQSVFVRPDEVLEIWRIFTPVLDRLSYLNEGGNGHECFPIHSYPQGISPDRAIELLKLAGGIA
jgi:glucose-6-phosphate 1-dehydrogenase